jgi:hypothetical protein
MRKGTNEVSITRIAFVYVVCLVVGGLSVLTAFLHANSAPIVLACGVAALAAIGGIIYCTRKIGRTLSA